MGSKGRMPPPHMRRPVPGPGMLHPDPFGPGIRPPSGGFPFDMLPPPEIMEQKLAAQHVDMERLLTENQRLAATHSVLRHELAASQQELQRLQTHMGGMRAEEEQQMMGLLDKIAKMEADLHASENLKMELQHAHSELQSLIAARQELFAKAEQLKQDMQRSHSEVQQIPAMMSELEGLRQEYQHCRATYDYERKLRIDHYESLQVMEKNYVSMVREVEKLRLELTNATNFDKSGGQQGNSGVKENDASGQRVVGQNAYEDGYGVSQQGRGLPVGAAAASYGGAAAASYGGGPAGTAPSRPGFDAPARGPTYDASRNPSYDASRIAAGYDNSRGGSYELPKGAAGYEAPRGGIGYDTTSRGAGGAPPTPAAGNTVSPYGATQMSGSYGLTQVPPPYGSAQLPTPYGSAQAPNPYGSTQAINPYGSSNTPTHAAGGYDAPPRSGGGGSSAIRR